MKKAWKYREDNQDYTYVHPALKGVDFSNSWVTICDGAITIKRGYAWDGCSPKFHFFGLFTFGTPDGALRLGLPWTYRASMVHDALCQFRAFIPISQRRVTRIFRDQLKESKWPLTGLYVWAVDKFGPQDFILDNQ